MDAVTNLLQLIVSGIMIGSIYSLIGMGFVITYRTTNVFNIAYGQFAVLGAFIAWSYIGSEIDPWPAFPLANSLIDEPVLAFLLSIYL